MGGVWFLVCLPAVSGVGMGGYVPGGFGDWSPSLYLCSSAMTHTNRQDRADAANSDAVREEGAAGGHARCVFSSLCGMLGQAQETASRA